jgi:glycosyltransferase involved in cell wall biosynthesis
VRTVSIITINRDNRAGLEKTIASVASQTKRPHEFIVIDGGSTDGSTDVISANQAAITSSVSGPDSGIYHAQNKGMKMATGDYLLFLNSGDVLFNGKVLETVAADLNDAALYYGDLVTEKDGKRTEHISAGEIDVDFMLNSTLWHPCTFIRRYLFESFGGYDETYRIAGDYEFFIRCLLKPGVKAQHLQLFVSLFDTTGISNDPSHAKLMEEERARAWRQNLSEVVYQDLRSHNAYNRSKYSKLVRLAQKLRGK